NVWSCDMGWLDCLPVDEVSPSSRRRPQKEDTDMVGLRCCNNAGVILAVLMSGLTSASPATALQAPTVLTLNDALRIAHESNPEFLRTSNDLDVAASSVRSAWGAFLPSLSAGMSFGGSRSTTTVGQDELGVPITSDRPVTYQSSNASQR